ncbi:cellulase family glycosylhydrolase [Demequina sp. SYSU T00192]|uniref:cellulase n=1 Tax=Demequina litoralis TaxID=3051660 RepID=A0ABT8G5E6_9MICO|nr:cellulase family glycosylhydrolase [Demequina sp. SYSU T00192]MDN4474361.1 cellulase family glycosylhydrolase [Demequina sp. SYSU T00192]
MSSRRPSASRLAWTAMLGVGAAALAITAAVTRADAPAAAPSTPAASPAATSPTPTPSPTPADPDVLADVELDALQQKQIDALRDFASWLEENAAAGFIGEVGWPSATDSDWDELGEYWYLLADQEGLWTAAWAAGSHWSSGYPLVTYGDSGSGSLDTASGQARVIEALQAGQDADGTGARHGVSLAGLEFGTENGFSSADPGTLGTDYFAEPVASYAWLAGRGIDLVRLPVRWERLQPALEGRLDPAQVAAVTAQLDAASAAGIDVILDLHNYGAYVTDAGTQLLGSDALPGARMTDVWLRIARTWGDHPALLGYGLMNEPHDLGGGDERGAAAVWEQMTQETVAALRAAGDEHLLVVAGYDWSSLARWRSTHPTGWIDDASGNFLYEAHHYWDAYGEGKYVLPYADELAATPAG